MGEYFENTKSGRKTWSPQDLGAYSKALTGGSDWVERFDTTHNHKYYENVKTGEKTWTLPQVQVEGGEWERKIDPASGHEYFENRKTRVKTWTDRSSGGTNSKGSV